jgi:hypothetical protein
LIRLDSAKEIQGLNLDFVALDLEFVASGLDFVAGSLEILHCAGGSALGVLSEGSSCAG